MGVWGLVNLKVNRNNFIYSGTNVRLNQISHQGSSIVISMAENNFIATNSFAVYLGTSSVRAPVNATDNFWDTLIGTEIAEKIYDLNDDPKYASTHIVYYLPFLTELFDQAGIEH